MRIRDRRVGRGRHRPPAGSTELPTVEGGLTGPVGATSRLPGVDGFRAAAVLAVLVYHNWLYTAPQPEDVGYLSRFVLPHLPVGVTMFFVLSGFLLYRPFVARILAERPLPHLRGYFRNRALRIFPAYWVILFATGVLLPANLIRGSGTELGLGRLTEQPGLLVANSFLMQNYVPGSMDTGIAPAWSLAVEVVFYLVLPFMGLLAASLAARAATFMGKVRAVVAPPLAMITVGVMTPTVRDHLLSGAAREILGRSVLNHVDLFAFGMLLAITMVVIEFGGLRLPRWWRIPASMAFAAILFVTVWLVDRGLIYTYKGAVEYELLTASCAAILLAMVVLPSEDGSLSMLTRVLETPVFVALGLVSYSLFLWHEPLQRFAFMQGWTFDGVGGFWANLVLIGLVAVGLAVLTYRLVELPALSRKRRDPEPSAAGRARAEPTSPGAGSE